MKEFSSLTFCKCLSQFEGTVFFCFRTQCYGWWFEFPILEICWDALWSWKMVSKNYFEFHKATWVIVSSFLLALFSFGWVLGSSFFPWISPFILFPRFHIWRWTITDSSRLGWNTHMCIWNIYFACYYSQSSNRSWIEVFWTRVLFFRQGNFLFQ